MSTPGNDPQHAMWQPDLRAAFASFDFEAKFPDQFPSQMHDQGSWADSIWIKSHLEEQGLTEVESRLVPGEFYVSNADEFVTVFGGMVGWVMNGWWSEEVRQAHPLEEVKRLTRDYLHEAHGGQGWTLKWAIVYSTGRRRVYV